MVIKIYIVPLHYIIYIYTCTCKTYGQIIAMRFQKYRLLTKINHDFDQKKIVCIALMINIRLKFQPFIKCHNVLYFIRKAWVEGKFTLAIQIAPLSAQFFIN